MKIILIQYYDGKSHLLIITLSGKNNKRIIILMKYTDCGKNRKKRILIVNIIMRY